MSVKQYGEKMYAGVLGKIIGVYMGRPVEGWPYQDIIDRFGFIDRYVAEEAGAPFIVPDDDISGTFNFYRALEDNGYPADITAEQIGEAWLNYIIEDKTVLWWGGLCRSTEHSAYLRLKAGIAPPRSGSAAMNGRAVAEQIGSQIFIDTWAMVNPGNPARAAAMARQASLVSHDGIAVEAAVYLAAMEAMAFEEKDVDTLLAKGRAFIADNEAGRRLNRLLDETLAQIERLDDWRDMRDWIEQNHGYQKYGGSCPMVTNHLAVVMALKYGGNDFRRSISIAASAGWDTDCNAGNVGCLNAIRLGLSAIDADAELRAPVADRMYVVSADGGDCLFDAVQETRKILAAAAYLAGEDAFALGIPSEKFAFEYPGSTQGFLLHPDGGFAQAVTGVENAWESTGSPGLLIHYKGVSQGITGTVSVQTYVDPAPKAAAGTSYFEVYASPSLYATQTVQAVVRCGQEQNPDLRFFIDYYNGHDEIERITDAARHPLVKGDNTLCWQVPDTQGRAVYRLGLELVTDERRDGSLCLVSLDWKGAPEHFCMGTAIELTPKLTPFTTRTKWMLSFMDSTKCTVPDGTATFAVTHPEDNGVLTIGSKEWKDYAVTSRIRFVHAKHGGLVARAKGHRRYYAALFSSGKYQIIRRRGWQVDVLCESSEGCAEEEVHELRFEVKGNALALFVDGRQVAACTDDAYSCGGAGFVVSDGAITATGFAVEQL